MADLPWVTLYEVHGHPSQSLYTPFGTWAHATAVTSLAPCFAIPPDSASLPTINPVIFCRKSNGIFRWQHNSTKCVPFIADSENRTPLLPKNRRKKSSIIVCTVCKI